MPKFVVRIWKMQFGKPLTALCPENRPGLEIQIINSQPKIYGQIKILLMWSVQFSIRTF